MKILLTGATGLVGKALIKELAQNGLDEISILTRSPKKAKQQFSIPLNIYQWSPEENQIDENSLKGVDVIIHLAGENIASARWSKRQKEHILNSRTMSTKLLVDKINELNLPIKKFISASAIGIYGNGEKQFNESTNLANDFLATVCKRWEEVSLNIKGPQTKIHHVRTGIVLDPSEGALSKMLPAFNLGVAGKLGSGNQYMSWIHVEDLARIYHFLIINDVDSMAVNATAPNPVTNKDFTKILGQVLSRPTILPAPAFALKAVLGELSTLLLEGQNVIPQVLLKTGFKFKYSDLKDALSNLVGVSKKFSQVQWVKSPLEETFKFFSDESNLQVITPDSLSFKVLDKSSDNVQRGTIINYQLQLYGVPFKWKTEIVDFQNNNQFIDKQLNGPYKLWLHTHRFKKFKDGTLILDDVKYQLPLGRWGLFFGGWFVKRDINKIFNYRYKKLEKLFNN